MKLSSIDLQQLPSFTVRDLVQSEQACHFHADFAGLML
jgi:hypothetical protein